MLSPNVYEDSDYLHQNPKGGLRNHKSANTWSISEIKTTEQGIERD